MLSREEIPSGNINDVRETALALYQENERLKEMVCSPIDFNHWKKDIEVKGKSLMKQYIDATYRVKELEAENARLRRETQSYKNLIARYEAVKPTNECIEACPYLSQTYANEEALRAVVEAAKKVAIGVRKQIEAQEAGFVSMGDLVALEAALEGLEGKC